MPKSHHTFLLTEKADIFWALYFSPEIPFQSKVSLHFVGSHFQRKTCNKKKKQTPKPNQANKKKLPEKQKTPWIAKTSFITCIHVNVDFKTIP